MLQIDFCKPLSKCMSSLIDLRQALMPLEKDCNFPDFEKALKMVAHVRTSDDFAWLESDMQKLQSQLQHAGGKESGWVLFCSVNVLVLAFVSINLLN